MKTFKFKDRLRKEIMVSSLITISLASLVIFGGLFGYYYYSINQEITEERERITKQYKSITSYLDENLEMYSETIFARYVDGKLTDRDLYEEYYHLLSRKERNIRIRLLLLDKNKNLLFDSEKKEDIRLIYFLNTVVDNNPLEEKVIRRIFMTPQREHTLLSLKKIKEDSYTIGYAAFLMNGNDFLQNSSGNGTQYLLYDNYHNVFSSSSFEFLKGSLEKVSSEVRDGNFQSEEGNYYSKHRLLESNMNLIVYKKLESLNILWRFSFSIVMILVFFLLLFSRYSSKKIAYNNSKYVEFISNEMKKVTNNKNYRFKIESKDEFQFLSENINQMLDELEELNQNNISLLKENVISERKMLEAQFNPHFLYNTLETIRVATYYDTELANKLILNLNTILRYSISKMNEVAAIKTDMLYIKNYLEICKERFERFTFDITIEEQTEEFLIPKLLILPIVENSMKYGFRDRRDLHLSINIVRTGESLTIQISDNGGGIDDSTLVKVNSNVFKKSGNHHGLYNAKRRLLLMYPNSYFKVKSPGEHTTVIMKIRE
ncbi:histidine kinase [Niallia circulans]